MLHDCCELWFAPQASSRLTFPNSRSTLLPTPPGDAVHTHSSSAEGRPFEHRDPLSLQHPPMLLLRAQGQLTVELSRHEDFRTICRQEVAKVDQSTGCSAVVEFDDLDPNTVWYHRTYLHNLRQGFDNPSATFSLKGMIQQNRSLACFLRARARVRVGDTGKGRDDPSAAFFRLKGIYILRIQKKGLSRVRVQGLRLGTTRPHPSSSLK